MGSAARTPKAAKAARLRGSIHVAQRRGLALVFKADRISVARTYGVSGFTRSSTGCDSRGSLHADDPVRYVAFLRGINVGGHKPVKMADLRTMFASMGFKNVKTILASGNVLFDVPPGVGLPDKALDLAAHIEERLQRSSGYPITVVLRTVADLQHLVDSDPFKGVAITPTTRLHVTFLSDPAARQPDLTHKAPENDLTIIRESPGEVCSVLTLSPAWGTTDLMTLLEKEFGRGVTTRNWNTISKIVRG